MEDHFEYLEDMAIDVPSAPKVMCAFLVHGTKDEIVPFSHGKALYDALPEACRTVEPFWAEGMGHNNIDADMRLGRGDKGSFFVSVRRPE